jgi:hypothetical protein
MEPKYFHAQTHDVNARFPFTYLRGLLRNKVQPHEF